MSEVAAPRYVRNASIFILLVLFVFATVVGRLATYLVFLAALAVILTPSVRTAKKLASRNIIDPIFLWVTVALTIAFAITTNELGDPFFALNFAPLLLAIPYRWQLERLARTDGAVILGWLCLAGTFVGGAVAVAQIYLLGYERVGQPIMSPFQYADTIMLLGFMALVGCFAPGNHRRLPFLAGPVVALGAVIISGTRGALLGAPMMAVLAFGFALFTARRKWLVLAGGVGVVLLAGALLFFARDLGFHRAIDAFNTAVHAMVGGEIDTSTQERLTMYEGAWEAFQHAPLFGYGWGDMVEAIYPYVPPVTLPKMETFRHLHNGLFSFGVSAGIIGVAAFLLLSFAPLVAVLRTPRDAQFASRLYLMLVLCVGYAVFQLTIIMLGFEFHTVQYAFMTMAILAFAREPGQSAAGNSAVGMDTA